MIGRTNAQTSSSGSTDMSGLRLKYLVFTSEAKWIEEDGGQITAGQVVTLKSGKNVSTAGSGTSDYVPNLTFDGWSSPLAISNNTITIPSTISQNIVVGAMYHTTDGSTVYVDKLGNATSVIPSTKTDLVRVYYPSSVTSIGSSAFSGCYALSSVVIPSSVTSIGSSAFTNCYALGIVTILATTPPALGGTSAFNTTYQKRIYVPAASVSAYKAATNWSALASIIYAIPS